MGWHLGHALWQGSEDAPSAPPPTGLVPRLLNPTPMGNRDTSVKGFSRSNSSPKSVDLKTQRLPKWAWFARANVLKGRRRQMTESCCPPGRKQAAVLWPAGGRGWAENTPWPISSKKTGTSIGQLRKWTLPNASELARGLRASAEDIWCQPADEQRIQFTWKKVAR